ncbi:hypothetical protein TNCV_520831 [Trichonephila clavipes]|nr:hypothetical protein TNCV_520831 [Trichonephila clavipes]
MKSCPNQKCILMWMDAFHKTENVSKERKGDPKKTIKKPENVKQKEGKCFRRNIKQVSRKKKLSLQNALNLFPNLPSVSSDAQTDNSSDEGMPANYLL